MWVRLPPWSLTTWGRRPTGGRPLRTREIRVQLPVAPLHNGREPDTGSPGRSAKARGRHWPEGSTPSPSAGRRPGGETDHHSALRTRHSRFESWLGYSECGMRSSRPSSGIPHSGRCSPWCSGFARDAVTVEVVGSTPPGLPVCRRGSTPGRHRPRKSAHAGANPAAGPPVS